jgi:hypothetical protein
MPESPVAGMEPSSGRGSIPSVSPVEGLTDPLLDSVGLVVGAVVISVGMVVTVGSGIRAGIVVTVGSVILPLGSSDTFFLPHAVKQTAIIRIATAAQRYFFICITSIFLSLTAIVFPRMDEINQRSLAGLQFFACFATKTVSGNFYQIPIAFSGISLYN